MHSDDLSQPVVQPALFDLGDVNTGIAELFPGVWSAAEGLISGEANMRRKAILYLSASDAARISPLVVYLLATRLGDADEEIRCMAVSALARLLEPDAQGKFTPEAVRQVLIDYLADMRTRQIYCILSVLHKFPELIQPVGRLLYAAPFGGAHLVDIAQSRKAPQEIRRYALQLIGSVGYLDVVPDLERMLQKIEVRVNGQQAMPFAPPSTGDDIGLLPDLKAALSMLRAK
jgi:hypothetical protein